MSRPDGGPAFPVADVAAAVPGTEEVMKAIARGMSLRDYFAAHAPVEPQAWFEPAMAEPRQKIPSPLDLSDDDRHHWRNYDECDPEDFHDRPQLQDWLQRRRVAVAKAEAWDLERAKQRLIQWPYAWADAQIAERGRP